MEEKNELNDIILNKSGSGSNSKKLLLAIATLTLVLIIVLVIMNSIKSGSDDQTQNAALPPEPSAPTEIIDDPLFEPVEVIEEGSNTTEAATATEDLGQIAQKIKQESFAQTPVEETVVEPAPAAAPVRQSAPAVQPKAVVTQTKPEPKPAPKTVSAPTVKTVKPAEPKPAAPVAAKPAAPKAAAPAPKPAAQAPAAAAPATAAPADVAPKAADTSGTYYIQVGSFTKEPSKTLFDRLNASGLKYTTVPSGSATKVLVGPFQGEKAAREVLGTVRKNIEAGAYIVKG